MVCSFIHVNTWGIFFRLLKTLNIFLVSTTKHAIINTLQIQIRYSLQHVNVLVTTFEALLYFPKWKYILQHTKHPHLFEICYSSTNCSTFKVAYILLKTMTGFNIPLNATSTPTISVFIVKVLIVLWFSMSVGTLKNSVQISWFPILHTMYLWKDEVL